MVTASTYKRVAKAVPGLWALSMYGFLTKSPQLQLGTRPPFIEHLKDTRTFQETAHWYFPPPALIHTTWPLWSPKPYPLCSFPRNLSLSFFDHSSPHKALWRYYVRKGSPKKGGAWLFMALSPVVGRQEWEDHELQASLVPMVRPA